jgi:hypothetical protein
MGNPNMLERCKLPNCQINSRSINMILAAVTMFLLLAVALSPQSLISNSTSAFAITNQQPQQQGHQGQPNINAVNLINTRTMVLPSNIKNLVVTIPDEAHHAPNAVPPKRFINQTYLPQNSVVNSGTTVVWFSSDVAHNHVIDLNDYNNASIFKSGVFVFNTATKPVKFNNTGTYTFSDPVNALTKEAGVTGFAMTGTVKVINPASSAHLASASNNGSKVDTVGADMVPSKTVDQYISEFKSHGFGIDSIQQFKALRNNSGQVLLVWTSSGMDLGKVLTALKQITLTLPYS